MNYRSNTLYRTRFLPDDVEITVEPDQDILTAALYAGVNLKYGCRHGNCSTCKHWLIEGDVDNSKASADAISHDDRENDAILLCCAYPTSDVVIEIESDITQPLPELIKPERRCAVVNEIEAVAGGHMTRLVVELDEPLSFRSGQFCEFILDDHASGEQVRRCYSIASSPAAGSKLEFCIKVVERGFFGTLLKNLTPGDKVELQGPFGTMSYKGDGREVVMAATGSGIAPLLSILRDLGEGDARPKITLYYGARSMIELGYVDELTALSRDRDWFECYFCISQEETPSDSDLYRSGRVVENMARDIASGSHLDAYICGAPGMCDTVTGLLEAKGVPESRIFADRFFPAAINLHDVK
ncbi:2Fe-2S iron-sulfur cluster-binding protein [Rhodococcus artemisiae]|uniref:2Fe-2S iron-sulfur cluster-binding protein n=1 Tax=Rhodococcus artemisiae TaxID=714159 RepID=A0ABU7LIY4_9NOCA|nr:2Fe-2S iron-sulfur cluster-binding protein [Rhodococcus artemisiae]MEE2061535.1 2Fe-2S iron-sulfur cluster-binding protein [Rhodococcus artemisiae]